jgi:L-fuconolactonase
MIIDTHTHFYDPTRPEGVPWPDPNDKVLYRRVMPEDYKALAVREGVTGTVIVEASKWLEDNQWILDLAADEPFIVGFVGHLEPTDDFEDNLNRFSANPLFRGIRLGGGHLRAIGDATFMANIEKLAAKELTLDLLINPDMLSTLPTLVEHTPEIRIVINHIAGVGISEEPHCRCRHIRRATRRGMGFRHPRSGALSEHLLQGLRISRTHRTNPRTDGCCLLHPNDRRSMGCLW